MCSIGAITHDDTNVVVDGSVCSYCMDCIAPCPTGAIDSWQNVTRAYSLAEQFNWHELPDLVAVDNALAEQEDNIEAIDGEIAALLEHAHQGAGGRVRAPLSASKPTINLFKLSKPTMAVVQGNFRLTAESSEADVRHIILDMGSTHFPVLEGQSVGISALGLDQAGNRHMPRLYSVSSPRDGERPNTNNLSLTVKRETQGLCSNYLCDLQRGDKVDVSGPFGATFLLPNDPQAKLIMICTGTGSAPFRAFTMRRQRTIPATNGSMRLFFGARTPESLPYFGPLQKIPDTFLETNFAFSRIKGGSKEYVQDKLLSAQDAIAAVLSEPTTYIYICGLKAMEHGVDKAFETIAENAALNWRDIRNQMRESGRYHVETY